MSLPTSNPSIPPQLIQSVVDYVREYMKAYDGSHDFFHIRRVLGLAHILRQQAPDAYPADLVTLAALLHDVGDKKYLKDKESAETMIWKVLTDLGADDDVAKRVQKVCSAVSYSSEIKPGGKEHVLEVVKEFPELAVVQDADRLDAIGAIGIARCLAFGGAKGRAVENSMEHFTDKLEKLGGMMKTEEGRVMAGIRTERIVRFRKAWEEDHRNASMPEQSNNPYLELVKLGPMAVAEAFADVGRNGGKLVDAFNGFQKVIESAGNVAKRGGFHFGVEDKVTGPKIKDIWQFKKDFNEEVGDTEQALILFVTGRGGEKNMVF